MAACFSPKQLITDFTIQCQQRFIHTGCSALRILRRRCFSHAAIFCLGLLHVNIPVLKDFHRASKSNQHSSHLSSGNIERVTPVSHNSLRRSYCSCSAVGLQCSSSISASFHALSHTTSTVPQHSHCLSCIRVVSWQRRR